jgi:hypothetical protein
MNYNFTLIKTKDDCLKLIATAKAEKENLEFRKSVLEHRVKTSSDNAVEIETDLQTINGQVSVSESIINSLPDGEAKSKEQIKLLGLEYKKAVLEQRKNSKGVTSILETEYDIGCIEQSITETDTFIASVNDRMGQL